MKVGEIVFNKHIYEVWSSMKKRCLNKKAINYERYGGRGITICSEWKESYETFYKWAINNGWEHGLQLDRIDNNKHYCPQNCKFSSPKEQANNRRSTVNITFNGKTQSMKMWAEEIKIPYETIHRRLTRLGWNLRDALTIPVRKHKEYKNSKYATQ